MILEITSFEAAEDAIRRVRDAVYGEEQQISRDLDWDGRDPGCVHVVARDEDGNPLGTGRLLPDGRIGRLAVLKPWRERGIGSGMLEALVGVARERNMREVYVHAQVHRAGFYQARGFRTVGDDFLEAGIAHVEMRRRVRTAGE